MSVHVNRCSRGARWFAAMFFLAGAGVVVDAPGRLTDGLRESHAQSIHQIIRELTGGGPGHRRSRSHRASRDMGIPPLPVKQPKPWHSKDYATETRPYPSTGPEPDWPLVLPAKSATATMPEPAISPRRPPVASPRRHLKMPIARPERAAAPALQRAGVAPATATVDAYTRVEVVAAKARCRRLLSKINAVVEPEAPIKKGPCGDAAPMKLLALGQSPQVKVSPPAIVNCDMVVALHDWLTTDLQPLARRYLKSPIVKLENMSSYSCRNAYGRKNTRLSEHAKANALDIRGFVTSKGRKARLLAHWGPTGRDIKAFRVAQAKAREKAEKLAEAKRAKAEAKRKAVAVTLKPAGATAMRRRTIIDGPRAVAATNGRGPSLSLAPSRLGGPVPVPVRLTGAEGLKASSPVVKARAAVEPKPSSTATALFLKKAHQKACRLFGTTLGPEANEAHRNHFHVDLAPRKYKNYCR